MKQWRSRVLVIVALALTLSLAGCTHTPESGGAPLAPSATVTASVSPTLAPIPASRPVELFLPKANARIGLAEQPCPVVDGMLDPDHSDYTLACYYTAPDKPYTLPASSTPDLTVIAGHTRPRSPAAFNVLYDAHQQRFTVAEGDELWVRTQASGQRWLRYRAVSFHTPLKHGGLANDASIWGTGPLPNRLLTIGCLRPSDPQVESSRNIVVVWDKVPD